VRLLYLIDGFWPRIGGMETNARQLLGGLRAGGDDVTVLTSRDDDRLPAREEHLGIDVRRLDLVTALSAGDPDRLLGVRRAVSAVAEEVAPDVLHVAFPGAAAYYALRLRASRPVPMVVGLHSGLEPHGRSAVLTRLLAEADWVIANSEWTAARALELAPPLAGRCTTILATSAPSGRPPLPPPGGPPVLATAGRHVPEKGFDILLEAFATVLAAVPDARLVLGGDGPERGRLQARAQALGVAGATDFAGWLDPGAWEDLLDRCTLAVVPSVYEPFGRVAVEAALRARPVVASRTGGLPEAAGGPDTCVLVAPGRPEPLAGALLELLRDPRRARRMGEAGRLRALAMVAATSPVQAHREIYQRIAG
jgi:glycogen(starch) synthase